MTTPSDNALKMLMDPPSDKPRVVSGPTPFTPSETNRSLERDALSPGTKGAH